jgi:hypothetical protein
VAGVGGLELANVASPGAICIGLFPASAKSLWYEMFWKTKEFGQRFVGDISEF